MLKQAIKQAEKSSFQRARIGCVIVKGSKVIGRGYNRINRHQTRIKSNHFPGSLHAEIAAVIDAIGHGKMDDLKGSTVFISRIKHSGGTAMACPCQDCMDVLNKFAKKIVFTTDIGEVAEIRL